MKEQRSDNFFSRHIRAFEVIILGISLLLLLILGFGESIRTYSTYKREGVYSLAESVKNSVESLLGSGLPLKSFIGFESIIEPIMETDKSISKIDITDNNGTTIFSSTTVPKKEELFTESGFQDNENLYITYNSDKHYRIVIALNNKFEKVGSLRIDIDRRTIIKPVYEYFKWIALGFIIILVLFILSSGYFERNRDRDQKRMITIMFSVCFMIMSIIVIYSLLNIYYDGIKLKSNNLVKSMSNRIAMIEKMDLDVRDIDRIDEVFDSYIANNKEISSISFIMNRERIFYSVNKNLTNSQLEDDSQNLNYSKQQGNTRITLKVFRKAIYKKLWNGIKNFIVLFIASIIMAVLFLNVLFSLKERKNTETREESGYLLELIKPVYFAGVFVEALNASFLPQFFREISDKSGLGDNFTSLLFTVFFISYGFILVPAAILCKKKGIKFTIISSLFLTGLGSISMAITMNYYLMFLIRLMIGLAQGMLLIAVQLYILGADRGANKTKSLAIIVIQYYSGRIAGTAIGALAFNYLNANGIFYLGGAVSLFIIFYSLKLIPENGFIESIEYKEAEKKQSGFVHKIKVMASDMEFLKTVLIGINAKLVMIGVIGFALPIIMEQLHFLREDIGQVLMLYSAGVLLSSIYLAKSDDQGINTSRILFIGNLGSAIGLIVMGTADLINIPSGMILVMIFAGTLLLGLSHGYIASPVSVNIIKTRTAQIFGKGETLSMLRLSERLGNIFGPIVLGYLLSLSHNSMAFIYIGVFVMLSSLFFLFGKRINRIVAMICLIILLQQTLTAGSYKDWMKFSPNISKVWQIKPVSDNEFVISSSLKNKLISKKRVMVIIGKESSAYPVALEAVLSFFEEKQVYPEFTVINYQENELSAGASFNRALREKYDLVMAMGSLATDYAYKNYKGKRIAIVSICAKDPVLMGYLKDYNTGSGNNIAYTSLNIPVEDQMVYLKKIVNKLENIGIMYEKDNKSAYLTQAKPLKDYAEKLGISVYEVVTENPERVKEELGSKITMVYKAMKQRDPLLKKSVFLVTGSTSIFSNLDTVNRYTGAVPVIGVSPSMIQSGENSATIAIGVGFEVNAQIGAIYALKILRGEVSPGNLKVGIVSPPDIAINFERCEAIKMKVPFSVLETAGYIINKKGETVKFQGIIRHP
jgi:putative ABC transport system substrate-binding protein